MRLRLATGGMAISLSAATFLPALAQPDNAVAVPPAPPLVAAPPTSLPPPPPVSAAPPPGLVQTPTPPANQDSGQDSSQDNGGTAAPPDQTVPPPLPSTWLPGKSAQIGILNKVDGSISSAVIPVGGQAAIGDLTISVLACVTRPADQIPDAAIFISAQTTSSDSGAPIYRGWMVRSAPGAAVVGDASEMFRVIGCS
jgi:hypothetical protein